jgi:hypothetical protein
MPEPRLPFGDLRLLRNSDQQDACFHKNTIARELAIALPLVHGQCVEDGGRDANEFERVPSSIAVLDRN